PALIRHPRNGGTLHACEPPPRGTLAKLPEADDLFFRFCQFPVGRPIVFFAGKMAGENLPQITYAVAVAVFVADILEPRFQSRRFAGLAEFATHFLQASAEGVVRLFVVLLDGGFISLVG